MTELEYHRVARIALDHAVRMQQEEPPPRKRGIRLRGVVYSSIAFSVFVVVVFAAQNGYLA